MPASKAGNRPRRPRRCRRESAGSTVRIWPRVIPIVRSRTSSARTRSRLRCTTWAIATTVAPNTRTARATSAISTGRHASLTA